MSEHARQATPQVVSGDRAIQRILELGLEPVDLDVALDAGEVAARQPDKAHPVMASGTYRWIETVAALRRRLEDRGWELTDPRNSPRVTNHDQRVAIVPMSGTWQTGLDGVGDPQTARAKGEATARAVQINVQLAFDLEVDLVDGAGEHDVAIATWVLLYYRDEKHSELRAELSLPISKNVRGSVTTWRERILLEPRTFGPDVQVPRDAKGGGDVDFTIEAV